MLKVSVIVPIFGVERYIENCARSILAQTYQNLEIIFVNDCTQDRSISILNEVVKDFPSRLQQIIIVDHNINKGLSAARNTGVSCCTGDYILHVDGDDYISNNLVEMCVQVAESSYADIVSFGYNKVYADRVEPNVPSKDVSLVDWKLGVLSGKYQHTLWGHLIKASIYKENNIVSVEGLHQGEDYAVIPIVSYYVQRRVVIDLPLYNYLIRNDIYKFKEKNVIDSFHAWKRIYEFYSKLDDFAFYELELYTYYQVMKLWLITSLYFSGNVSSGRKVINDYFPHINKSIHLPFPKKNLLFLYEHNSHILLPILMCLFKFYKKNRQEQLV